MLTHRWSIGIFFTCTENFSVLEIGKESSKSSHLSAEAMLTLEETTNIVSILQSDKCLQAILDQFHKSFKPEVCVVWLLLARNTTAKIGQGTKLLRRMSLVGCPTH